MLEEDVLKYELIGLDVSVTKAKNSSLVGLHGRIVEETRNTLKIRYGTGEKTLIKNQVVLAAVIGRRKIEIDGASLVGRPEERLKKKW